MSGTPHSPTDLRRTVHDFVAAGASNELTENLWADFERLLREDDEACRLYVDYVGISVLLPSILSSTSLDECPPLEVSSVEQQPAAPGLPGNLWHGAVGYFSSGWPVAYLVATVIFGVGALAGSFIYVSNPAQVAETDRPSASSVSEPTMEFVGRITGMADCQWAKGSTPLLADEPVPLGRDFTLDSGFVELSYNTGAKVILQGPVTYRAETNGGYLAVGKLTGKLETKTQGPKPKTQDLFSIRTPTATVTDLGTEFGVEVGPDGAADAHVFAGKVQVEQTGQLGKMSDRPRVIGAGQCAHVARTGQVSVLRNEQLPAESAKRFTRAMPTPSRAPSAEAYAQLVLAMKPYAYYRMERPKGVRDVSDGKLQKDGTVQFTVADSAPGGHHGTLHLANEYGGDPWWAGRFGNAIHFRGRNVGDYIVVRDFPASKTSQLSFSAWVFASSKLNTLRIASQGTPRPYSAAFPGGQLGVGFDMGSSVLSLVVRDSHGVERWIHEEDAVSPFPLGQWQHVAFVADGSIMHLYRNGAEVASGACEGVVKVPPVKCFTIGCQNFAGISDPPDMVRPDSLWSGLLDEFAVFDHALTAAQVRQLFEGQYERAKEVTDKHK